MTTQSIPFSSYMREALYGQNGYYMVDRHRFGKSGDFFTSAQVSPVFGELWASFVIQSMPDNEIHIIEFGPGDGDFAISLLKALLHRQSKPVHYAGIEVSPIGRSRVKDKLDRVKDAAPSDRLSAEIYESVEELTLTQSCSWEGCFVFANEWLDAFPCDLVRVSRNGAVDTLWIEPNMADEEVTSTSSSESGPFRGKHLQSKWKPSMEPTLIAYVNDWIMSLFQEYEDEHLVAEVSLEGLSAARNVVEQLHPEVLALVDYGGYTLDIVGPDRPHGSIRAFCEHRLVDDFLDLQGGVDLTYDVDFKPYLRLLQQMGYRTALKKQGVFLVTQPFFEAVVNERAATDPRVYQAIKTLVLPGGMGERFMVLLAERGQ